jgi:hypothetical protein
MSTEGYYDNMPFNRGQHQHLRDTLSTSLCRQLIVVGIHPSNK